MTNIKHHFNTIDLTGKKFGKLLVVNQLVKRGNAGQIRWECLCDCGAKHITTGECIRGGKSKSCGCVRAGAPYNKEKNREIAIWKQLYNSTIVKRSKKWGIRSDIDLDDFLKMSKEKCNYCGLENSNFATDRGHINRTGRKISDTIVVYNGIDRLDSKSGYTKKNSVTCCKYCNTAKNTMSREDFIRFIKRIYDYNF